MRRGERPASSQARSNDTANFRNPNYRTASDTADTLDYERLADITAAVGVAVENEE